MVLNELKRVLTSKRFIATVIIGLIIASLGIYFEVKEYLFFDYNAPDLQTPEAQANVKMMIDNGYNKYALWFSTFTMFIVIMPILSVLPYGLSYIEEKENGMIKQIDLRMNHKKYIKSKLIINGIAGGLAVILPTIIMTIIIFIFFKGNIEEFYGYGKVGGPFTSILTQNFFIYMIIHLFINFIFGFAYATIGLGISALINNKIAIILSPFIFWISTSIIFSILEINHYSPSLINQFYTGVNVAINEIFIVLGLIFTIFSAVFLTRTRKEYIYEK